jgi:hypothetical protein
MWHDRVLFFVGTKRPNILIKTYGDCRIYVLIPHDTPARKCEDKTGFDENTTFLGRRVYRRSIRHVLRFRLIMGR